MRLMTVMSHQRSGTHFLGSCIGSHPAVKYTGEIFGGGKLPGSEERLKEILGRVMCGGFEVVCLDTKYNQINRYVAALLAQDGVKVVHLIRRNLLRLYFSGELHTWRGQNPGNKKMPTFQFHPKRFSAIERQIEGYRRRFAYLADVTVYYEELSGNRATRRLPKRTAEMVCGMADVEYMPLTTDHKKRAPVDFLRYLKGVPTQLVEKYEGEG